MIYELLPLEEPFTEKISAALCQYPTVGGQLIALFRTFANSTRFLEKGVPNLLDDKSPLTLKEREIVILRVTANNNCEYEWGVHVAVFGEAAGFDKAQIVDICKADFDPALWSTKERMVLNVVDQLCCSADIDEVGHAEFQRHCTVEEQLEIFALCGTYHTISFVANVAKLPLESFAVQFPNRL